jgi:hypothetical protein
MSDLLIREKISALEAELKTLEGELVSLKGKLAGRKEAIAKTLRNDATAKREKVEALAQVAHSLALDSLKPRNTVEAQATLERLKTEIISYCTKNNVDPELWKSLAS